MNRTTTVATAFAAVVLAGTDLTAQPAQGTSVGGFSLTFGFVDYDLRDQVLNPLAHKGRLGSLGLTYEQSGTGSRHRFDLELAVAPLRSRFESEWGSVATDLKLAYRSAWEVARPGRAFAIHVGGVFDVLSHMAYFGKWDDSHVYWLTAYALGPTAMATYEAGDAHALTLEARLPVVALVSRPEALIDYKAANPDAGWIVKKLHEGIGLRSLNEHVALDVALRYQRPVGSRIRGVFWQMIYLQNHQTDSADLEVLRYALGISVGL
ncbi:MAG: hypothetical protein P8170_22665 [Gemmatimonadota bacterium]